MGTNFDDMQPAHEHPGSRILASERDRLEVELPPAPVAPGIARQTLQPLATVADPDRLYELRLLVTELVTNSVKHGDLRPGDAIKLLIHLRDDTVRVEVEDAGRGFSSAPRPRSGAGSGWGLYLVEQLADRWGVRRRDGDGMAVWFELDLTERAGTTNG